MNRPLTRLLNPETVAVIGGGAWCSAVIAQLEKLGFQGEIWPVHPAKAEVAGRKAVAGVPDLPDAPDAAFIGINREATIGALERLRRKGAGGAVCFASGFAEVSDGGDLNARLLNAAGDMPVLGPNCYGFINALNGAALWPDQHGCLPCDRGVAILTQSSNIAINLTMQHRGLPISHVITTGNQAQISQAEIACALLEDDRVTAIGLHVEGFGDISRWEALARDAADKGIPLVALKVGRSEEAQAGAVSHTASLAGSDAGSTALMERLGITRVDDLPDMIETLKLLHVAGRMPHGRITTVSCSGGEASLAADLAAPLGLTFPPLTRAQTEGLGAALGPKVALANPLDYHTYIWRDVDAMTRTFAAAQDEDVAMTVLIADFPRADRCDPTDWGDIVAAAKAAKAQTGLPLAVAATLPELMPEDVAAELMDAGIVPFCGLAQALRAIAAAEEPLTADLQRDLLQGAPGTGRVISEANAKALLQSYGVDIPRAAARDEAATLDAPLVLKGEGFTHKTDHGAVRLNLTEAELDQAMAEMDAPSYLIEEMVQGGVAEVLIGVTLDPACGFTLTLGSGGTLTELWDDARNLLLPTTPDAVHDALMDLKTAPLLMGYRDQPAADLDCIVEAVMAVQDFVADHADRVSEVEINPLICTPTAAVAADALIRMTDDEPD